PQVQLLVCRGRISDGWTGFGAPTDKLCPEFPGGFAQKSVPDGIRTEFFLFCRGRIFSSWGFCPAFVHDGIRTESLPRFCPRRNSDKASPREFGRNSGNSP